MIRFSPFLGSSRTLLRHSLRSNCTTRPLIHFPKSCSTTTRTVTPTSRSFLHRYRLAVALSPIAGALILPNLSSRNELNCSTVTSSLADPLNVQLTQAEKKEAMLNIYKLGFGTVSGICVGLFLVKGLKMIAIISGGVFVLLQYLANKKFIAVDWGSISHSYDTVIDGDGVVTKRQRQSRLGRLIRGTVEFLTSDLQSRGSFLVGLGIGVRIRGV